MKKNVGLIIDSPIVSRYIADLIDLSKNSEHYQITTLIINANAQKQRSNIKILSLYIRQKGLRRLLRSIAFKIVVKTESIFLKRNARFRRFFEKVHLAESNFTTILVDPEISRNGLIYRYSEKDINAIKRLNLNLLIRGGSGILKGEILNICPNGVISFHHADNAINRGGPPAFWEVYERNARTGFVIQRLTEELDGGSILYRGAIATSWFYSMNLARLYEITNPFLHQVLNELTSEFSKSTPHRRAPYSYRLYTTPDLFQVSIYIMKTLSLLGAKVFRKSLGRARRWNVAYQHSESWQDVTLWRSKKIKNPKDRYLADPFIVEKDGDHYCFVEDFDCRNGKGRIAAYKIAPSGYQSLGVVLEEDFHLSYPFIFRYEDEFFMCPETHKKGEIRLYKCTDFPQQWTFESTIFKNITAADTNIFEHDGRWWMFANVDGSVVEDLSCQLHIFSSESPISDKWEPHAKNPVIFDSKTARNGGMILDDGEVYRVFQRQGFDTYGEACGVAKITHLSDTEYREEILCTIEPKFFDSIKGVHTFNYDSGIVAFDYATMGKAKSVN